MTTALYSGFPDDEHSDVEDYEYCFVCPPINKGDVITWYEHGHNGREEWKRTATVLAVCPEDADSCPLVTSIPLSTLNQYSLVTRIKKLVNGYLVDVPNPTSCHLEDIPLTKQGDKDDAIRTSLECSGNRMARAMQLATRTTQARLKADCLWDHSDIVKTPKLQNKFGAMNIETECDYSSVGQMHHGNNYQVTSRSVRGSAGVDDGDSEEGDDGDSVDTMDNEEKEFITSIADSTRRHNEKVQLFRQQIANLGDKDYSSSSSSSGNGTNKDEDDHLTQHEASNHDKDAFDQLWREEGISTDDDSSCSSLVSATEPAAISPPNKNMTESVMMPTEEIYIHQSPQHHNRCSNSKDPVASPEKKRMKTNTVCAPDGNIAADADDSILTTAYLSSLNSIETQKLLATEMMCLCSPWHGSLPFECYICHEDEDIKEVIQLTSIVQIDITHYLGNSEFRAKGIYFKGLYFCPDKYPPTLHDYFGKNSSFSKLKVDLELAGHGAGSPVHSNGGGKRSRLFNCIAGRARSLPSPRPLDDHDGGTDCDTGQKSTYRRTTLKNNDKQNRRSAGKRGIRRNKSIVSNKTCGFHFTVMCDEVGYYINLNRGAGCGCHQNHSQVTDRLSNPYPCRLLSTEEKVKMIELSKATASKGAVRNNAIMSWNKAVTKSVVEYVTRVACDELPDDISRMIQSFTDSPDISYTIMSDIPISEFAEHVLDSDVGMGNDIECLNGSSSSVSVSTTKTIGGHVSIERAASIKGLDGFDAMALSARTNRKIQSSQSLFFSIGWLYLPSFRFFKLCPEVIWCDVTSHSNNKGYNLLTLSCRTSADKQVVFLYLWIPNEQRQSFRWVFQHAIPRLIPNWLTSRVQFIMKDGDPQQRNEILIAMLHTKVFCNATEGQCGWHIVNQGWMRHVLGEKSLDPAAIPKWQSISRTIKAWLYSWMEPGYCETEEEYRVSKKLLMMFIRSNTVLEAVGSNPYMLQTVIQFIKRHVIVYESLYVFYKRKRVRHFDTSTSSAHEGTNFGLKSNASAMKPTMTMDTASQAMIVHAKVLGITQEQQLYLDYHKSNKLWSTLPTSPFTTSFAEGLIVEVWERRHLYNGARIGERQFQVKYIGHGGTGSAASVNCKRESGGVQDYNSLIPKYDRMRTVTIEPDGTMLCSCCRFESTGIFCVHQVAIANMIFGCHGHLFKGFTHCDIAIRYRNDYMHLAYKDTTPERLQTCFHALAINDIHGPNIGIDIPTAQVMPIESPVLHGSAVDRLKNYDDSVKTNLQRENDDTTTSTSDDGMYTYDRILPSNKTSGNERRNAVGETIYDVGMSNSAIPDGAMAGHSSRSILRSVSDTSFGLADQLGEPGRVKLEQMHRDFHAWASKTIAENERKDSTDRITRGDDEMTMDMVTAPRLNVVKNVPITQEIYEGPERCYNTKKNYYQR